MPSTRKIMNAAGAGAIPSVINQVLSAVRKAAEAKGEFARIKLMLDAMLGTQLVLSSLTPAGGTATAVCTGHGLASGDWISVFGATTAAYNKTKAVTVVDANTFTYPVPSGSASPAGGSPVANSHKQLQKELGLDGGTAMDVYNYLINAKSNLDTVAVADLDQN